MTGRRIFMPLDLFKRSTLTERQVYFDNDVRKHVDKQQRLQKEHFDKRYAVKETGLI